MKIIKRANRKYSLKISSFEWELMGLKNKWLPTICANIITSQNELIKIAQVDVDIDIENAIKNSIVFDYNKFALKQEDETVNEVIAREAITNAFIKIAQREESFANKIKAYVNANRKFKLGVYFSKDNDKTYLVPTFDGIGISELKSEFSSYIPYEIAPPPFTKHIDYGEVTIKGADDIEDVLLMVNAAGFVTQNGQVNIGTIGSRKTNWDTSYNFHVSGVSARILQELLTWFTDISNEDIRNIVRTERKETFDLTQAKEVHALMSRLGLTKLFYDTVRKIKDFEEKKGLKRKHQRLKHIPDNKKNTLIETIDLSQYRDQIFTFLLNKITSNPRYMDMINRAGIRDIQEAVDLAFSMGSNGRVMTKNQARQLVETSAA